MARILSQHTERYLESSDARSRGQLGYTLRAMLISKCRQPYLIFDGDLPSLIGSNAQQR